MKEGDLVEWIGFPGADKIGVEVTGPSCKTGIIIKLIRNQDGSIGRLDVLWSSGTIGAALYPETIRLIN